MGNKIHSSVFVLDGSEIFRKKQNKNQCTWMLTYQYNRFTENCQKRENM